MQVRRIVGDSDADNGNGERQRRHGMTGLTKAAFTASRDPCADPLKGARF
jgi:hypothetical protein